ncbi:ketoacyl-synt-domain-containing protein [Fomitopsis serialis]|uniref:ketoacyl-synt-domain-containing protein n=1 Tax=Fomitopsis serialis TaxID=139415 RepID=UPI002007932F|nr:ketoacyl-synt-domain-containing protein [Neoantrodia serialis]KAH9934295.1 ketoacyl-synt-domain-containing protein [Neoantrodia serialis]
MSHSGKGFPVAIVSDSTGNLLVGISAELPSGGCSDSNLDYKSFYDFLIQGGEAYEKIPTKRFNVHTLKGTAPGQVVTDTGAFLKNIDLFDPTEFGIAGKDARLMTLGTRKLLETTFLALVDSGIDYRGQNVGCYMSAVSHDIFSVSGHDDMEVRGAPSWAPSMVANRVSYHLDLRGPTIPLDTACSSTLYATHLAVQALRNGDCEAAVVGGCQLNHRMASVHQAGILSPDGKSQPFDASANGFGRGEAVVSIVLKPLHAALRDCDRIYAAILGTGVNSSGSLAPISAPVASAQQDAMLRAFAQAGRSPREVDFIELHATGTASGDPTEANWVGAQFRRDAELLVGSVKGNIGHTEIAAFLSSLCKVCHIIEHGVIPPTVNFSVPNPAIRWAEYNMRVPVTSEKLAICSPSGHALIAMSSSGIGGANGHCVIESHTSNTGDVPRIWSCGRSMMPLLLIAGGLSPRSASAVGESLKSVLVDCDRMQVGRVLGRRARSMLWKAYSVTPEGQIPRFSEPVITPKITPEVVFVFSGQGPQHWNMGRELFKTCVPFHDTVVELDHVYAGVTGKSLITHIGLFDDSNIPDNLGDVWPASITLPALTILQIALVETLAAIGVKPDVVVGHSAGETAVLYASGAASKGMAVELAIARGQVMEALEGHGGTMAALACSSELAKEIIAEVIAELGPAVLEIGCFNAPNAVTLSGSAQHVSSAVQRAKATGILATSLRTRVAVHSSMMTFCQAEYEELVGKVFETHSIGSTKVETFSTLSGDIQSAPFDAPYFWNNTLGPVMFDLAVTSIQARHPRAIFVELGPHPGATVLSPLKRSKSVEVGELTPIIDFVGQLACAGYSGVDMDVLYGTAESQGAALPQYPFMRKEVPYVAPTFEITRQRQARNGPLNYPQLRINTQTHPGLADHIIKNEPIMPASGFLEMALEFGAWRLWDVQFHSMLSLSGELPTPIDVKLEGSKWRVCSAAGADFTKMWPPTYHRVHATGYLSKEREDDATSSIVPLDDIRARLTKRETKSFYDSLGSFANYGPSYKRVLSWYHGVDSSGLEELLIELRGAGDDLDNLSDYRLHPAILDAALHVAVHPWITGAVAHGLYYLPSKVGALILHDSLAQGIPERIYAYGVFTVYAHDMPESLTYDFQLTNEHGETLCTVQALEVAAHGRAPPLVRNRPVLVCSARRRQRTPTAYSLEDEICDLRVFQYHRGNEITKLQQAICSLNTSDRESLCFITREGTDGDAILGFTRSLRKEYPSWRVFCIVFPSSWPLGEHDEAARSLCAHPLAEHEMLLNEDGSVRAPRLIASSAPRRTTAFDSEAPWVSKPAVPPGHVLIKVTGVTSTISSCWIFVGHVAGSSVNYLGITFKPLTNHIVAHRGSLLELGTGEDLQRGPPALAAIIATLAVGPAICSDPQRLQDSYILVTHSDAVIGQDIRQFYEDRGLHVLRLPSQASSSETRAVLAHQPKFVVSGRLRMTGSDVDKTVTELQSGKVFQWDDPSSGVARVLAEDPWVVGDALKVALSDRGSSNEVFVPPIQMVGVAPPVEVPLQTSIFDSEKTYILVGGIGGLGMHVAHWMYQNGAREIVLTSRSGTANLVPKDEFIALRLLAYLRSRDDLVLRTEAVDASSFEQTKGLVASIKKPIGGCMIMTAILIDRTFPLQTHETFEGPFVAKVGAFQALEKAINIDSLDFMLLFSSVAGMTGNAGQTNYSSANTALTGFTRRYPNAATIVPPMMSDTGVVLTVAATDSIRWSRYRHLSSWAMTCQELCECIHETLLKLREGPLWQYIPDFDWSLVQSNLGHSPLYDHLVPKATLSDTSQVSSDVLERNLSDVICEVLDIDSEDLSPEAPLTSYGLDSLSATRLSRVLEPYLIISQLQLLADITLADLQRFREKASDAQPVTRLDARTIREKAHETTCMLEKYSSDLPSRNVITRVDMDKTVLLTGATGRIGSHVLAHLLSDSSYDKVIVIVRRQSSGRSAPDRLLDAFAAQDLDTSVLNSHALTIWEGDVTKTKFGLSFEAYDEVRTIVLQSRKRYSLRPHMQLLRSVTHIVHLGTDVFTE